MNPMELEMDRDLAQEDWVEEMEREGRVVWKDQATKEDWETMERSLNKFPSYYQEIEKNGELVGIISLEETND